MRHYCLIFFILLMQLSPLVGQRSFERLIRSDDHQELQIGDVYDLYSDSINTSRDFINGKEYENYYNPVYTNPLLRPAEQHSATIFIKGKKYENLILQYDTFLDEVIYRDQNRLINNTFYKIELNKGMVDAFILEFSDDYMQFKYIEIPGHVESKLKSGFYEVLYDGGSQFIIKHQSYLTKEGGRDIYKYSPKNYVRIHDVYYKFKTRRSLLRLFGSHTREVKKYLRTNNIYFRDANKFQIAGIIRYYDSLTTP